MFRPRLQPINAKLCRTGIELRASQHAVEELIRDHDGNASAERSPLAPLSACFCGNNNSDSELPEPAFFISFESILFAERFAESGPETISPPVTPQPSSAGKAEIVVTFAYCRKSKYPSRTPTPHPPYNNTIPESAHLRPKTVCVSLPLPEGGAETPEELVALLLRRSYAAAPPARKLLVLVNPHGGKFAATKIFHSKCLPLLEAARCSVTIQLTQYYRHAYDFARDPGNDLLQYDMILCVSGDGIPHEVINGVGQRADAAEIFARVTFGQLPGGSGNAMSVSCNHTSNPSVAVISVLKGVARPVDLMAIRQGSGAAETLSLSFLSQSYGMVADAEVSTDAWRFLGSKRFELGVLLRVLGHAKYPCRIWVKYVAQGKRGALEMFEDSAARRGEIEAENGVVDSKIGDSATISATASATVSNSVSASPFASHVASLLRFPSLDSPVPSDWTEVDRSVAESAGLVYVGKMPWIAGDAMFFPLALPDDGTMDFVAISTETPIHKVLAMFGKVENGKHLSMPEIEYSKIAGLRLEPLADRQFLSVDGELFPKGPFQVEVLPKFCRLVMREGQYTDVGYTGRGK